MNRVTAFSVGLAIIACGGRTDDTSGMTSAVADATLDEPTSGECPMSAHCGTPCPSGPTFADECTALDTVCLEWSLPAEACNALATRCRAINPTDEAACESLADFGEKLSVCGKNKGDGGLEAECRCVLGCFQ